MSKNPKGYKLLISTKAKNALKTLPKSYQQVIVLALEEIQTDPLIGKPLTRELTGQFSYRAGVYRIIYRVNKKDKTVQVLSAGHRASIYK